MNNLEITILSKNQLLGNKQLVIFQKRGLKAAISDYAILLGGAVSNSCYIENKKHPKNRTGCYWTKTEEDQEKKNISYNLQNKNNIYIISFNGDNCGPDINEPGISVRPILPFSSISNNCSNLKKTKDGILEVEYGEYPQQAAPRYLQNTLEKLYHKKSLAKTGKTYTRSIQIEGQSTLQIQEEFRYSSSRYIRVQAEAYSSNWFQLSNGGNYHNRYKYYPSGDYVWIEIKPIRWLVDKKNDIAITDKLLFAGIEFNDMEKNEKDFKKTNIHRYLNTYFAKEIIPISTIPLQKCDKSAINLQQEKRKPIITENNLIHQEDVNIIINLATNLRVNNIITKNTNKEYTEIIVEDLQNTQKQKIYSLK